MAKAVSWADFKEEVQLCLKEILRLFLQAHFGDASAIQMFLTGVQHLPRVDPGHDFRHWLKAIAQNWTGRFSKVYPHENSSNKFITAVATFLNQEHHQGLHSWFEVNEFVTNLGNFLSLISKVKPGGNAKLAIPKAAEAAQHLQTLYNSVVKVGDHVNMEMSGMILVKPEAHVTVAAGITVKSNAPMPTSETDKAKKLCQRMLGFSPQSVDTSQSNTVFRFSKEAEAKQFLERIGTNFSQFGLVMESSTGSSFLALGFPPHFLLPDVVDFYTDKDICEAAIDGVQGNPSLGYVTFHSSSPASLFPSIYNGSEITYVPLKCTSLVQLSNLPPFGIEAATLTQRLNTLLGANSVERVHCPPTNGEASALVCFQSPEAYADLISLGSFSLSEVGTAVGGASAATLVAPSPGATHTKKAIVFQQGTDDKLQFHAIHKTVLLKLLPKEWSKLCDDLSVGVDWEATTDRLFLPARIKPLSGSLTPGLCAQVQQAAAALLQPLQVIEGCFYDSDQKYLPAIKKLEELAISKLSNGKIVATTISSPSRRLAGNIFSRIPMAALRGADAELDACLGALQQNRYTELKLGQFNFSEEDVYSLQTKYRALLVVKKAPQTKVELSVLALSPADAAELEAAVKALDQLMNYTQQVEMEAAQVEWFKRVGSAALAKIVQDHKADQVQFSFKTKQGFVQLRGPQAQVQAVVKEVGQLAESLVVAETEPRQFAEYKLLLGSPQVQQEMLLSDSCLYLPAAEPEEGVGKKPTASPKKGSPAPSKRATAAPPAAKKAGTPGACKYGAGCTRRNSGCIFDHSTGAPPAPCKFGAGCNRRNSGCTFSHDAVASPAPCKFGAGCNRRNSGCTFSHDAVASPAPCKYGPGCTRRNSGCTFSHGPEVQAAAAPTPAPRKRPNRRQCHYGSRCTRKNKGCLFAHPTVKCPSGANCPQRDSGCPNRHPRTTGAPKAARAPKKLKAQKNRYLQTVTANVCATSVDGAAQLIRFIENERLAAPAYIDINAICDRSTVVPKLAEWNKRYGVFTAIIDGELPDDSNDEDDEDYEASSTGESETSVSSDASAAGQMKKLLMIKGLDSESIKTARAEIALFLDELAAKASVDVELLQHLYLKDRCVETLNQLSSANLKITFTPPQPGSEDASIVFEGPFGLTRTAEATLFKELVTWQEDSFVVERKNCAFYRVALRKLAAEHGIAYFIPKTKDSKSADTPFWKETSASGSPQQAGVEIKLGGSATKLAAAMTEAHALRPQSLRLQLTPQSYKDIAGKLEANDNKLKKSFQNDLGVLLSFDAKSSSIWIVGDADDANHAKEQLDRHSISKHQDNVKMLSAFHYFFLRLKYPGPNQLESLCLPAKLKVAAAGSYGDATNQGGKKILIFGTDAQVAAAGKKLNDEQDLINQQLKKRDVPTQLPASALVSSGLLKECKAWKTWIETPTCNSAIYSTQVGNVTIQVVQGNIINETRVDCITNAANSQLAHGGGIAGAIAQAAGPVFVQACDDYIQKAKQLPVGQAWACTPGNLSSLKAIINAVGPRWEGGNSNEDKFLAFAVKSTLDTAGLLQARSVAMPVLSSGIFGYPLQLCTSVIANELVRYCKTAAGLNLVKVVSTDDRQCAEMATALAAACSSKHSVSVESLQNIAALPTRALVQVKSQWHWQENDGSFVAYDEDQNRVIEEAFQSGRPSIEDITGDRDKVKNGWIYRIVFDKSGNYQQNTQTGTKRALKTTPYTEKVKPSAQPVLPPRATAAAVSAAPGLQMVQPGEFLTFFALSDAQLTSGIAQFSDWMKSLQTTQVIPNVGSLSGAKLKELESIALANRVSISYNRAQNSLVLTGLDKAVSVVDNKIAHSLRGGASELEYPAKWEHDPSNDDKTILVEISPASPEGLVVLTQLQKTMPNARVSKIERVQNPFLWRVYSGKRNDLIAKYRGLAVDTSAFERLLFHGTRQTTPQTIYASEDGFVSNFSDSGMWGRGIYFAENASYSHSYAHTANGCRQFFLAQVLVGIPKDMSPDGSIRQPPNNPATQKRFDSITGQTGGSNVFIFYTNSIAYPSYLISYTQ